MVRFVPGHPSFNRIDSERELLGPAVTAGIGVGLFVLWILLFGLSSFASLAMGLPRFRGQVNAFGLLVQS